jgi:hypothetical protein
MTTTASFIYAAYLFCDDTIMPLNADEEGMVWHTSKHFHKTFVKCAGYSLEFDTNADHNYDANGLGRIHKAGASGAICLSAPFAKTPNYKTNGYENKSSFSICPAIKNTQGEWLYASDSAVVYTLTFENTKENMVQVGFTCKFADGRKVEFICTIDEKGVLVCVNGEKEQEIGICLPIFMFDGEKYAKMTEAAGKILVAYDGWICEYQAEDIQNLNVDVVNRNGAYKCYLANGMGETAVRIKIYPCV